MWFWWIKIILSLIYPCEYQRSYGNVTNNLYTCCSLWFFIVKSNYIFLLYIYQSDILCILQFLPSVVNNELYTQSNKHKLSSINCSEVDSTFIIWVKAVYRDVESMYALNYTNENKIGFILLKNFLPVFLCKSWL